MNQVDAQLNQENRKSSLSLQSWSKAHEVLVKIGSALFKVENALGFDYPEADAKEKANGLAHDHP